MILFSHFFSCPCLANQGIQDLYKCDNCAFSITYLTLPLPVSSSLSLLLFLHFTPSLAFPLSSPLPQNYPFIFHSPQAKKKLSPLDPELAGRVCSAVGERRKEIREAVVREALRKTRRLTDFDWNVRVGILYLPSCFFPASVFLFLLILLYFFYFFFFNYFYNLCFYVVFLCFFSTKFMCFFSFFFCYCMYYLHSFFSHLVCFAFLCYFCVFLFLSFSKFSNLHVALPS